MRIYPLKALCHDIRAIFSKLVSHWHEITTPMHALIENSVWEFNLVGAGSHVMCDTNLLKIILIS